MTMTSVFERISQRILKAKTRYGAYTSTHEALGVALEEWDEFREAIQQNDLERIQCEALDLAAVMVRLVIEIDTEASLRDRSVK